MSAYLRVFDPDTGDSFRVDIVEDMEITKIEFVIGIIPVWIDVDFALASEVRVVESTMEFMLFTGMDAHASLEIGVQYDSETDAGFELISDADWEYNSSPLSLQGESEGMLNARLYVIPRFIFTPYSLIGAFVELKPYVGARLWTSDAEPPEDIESIADFDQWTVPQTPAPVRVISVTRSSILFEWDEPAHDYGSITKYEVAYSEEGFFWDDDWAVLSILGFYQHLGGYQILPEHALVTHDLKSNADGVDDGTVVTCADLCMKLAACHWFSFSRSTKMCVLASDTYDQGNLAIGDGTHAAYRIFDPQLRMYEIRDGDPLGFEADRISGVEVDTYEESYKIRFRARNEKGWSDWSSAVTGIEAWLHVTGCEINGDHLRCSIETNIAQGQHVRWSEAHASSRAGMFRRFTDFSLHSDCRCITEYSLAFGAATATKRGGKSRRTSIIPGTCAPSSR